MLDIDDTVIPYLNLTDVDEAQEGVLTSIEAMAVSYFERETGRYFGETQTVQEIWDGVASRHIYLRDIPDVSTVALTMGYRGLGTLDWTDFPTGCYELLGRRVTFFPNLFVNSSGDPFTVPFNANGWPAGYSNLRATYVRGYATEDDVPADVRQAVLELISIMYRDRVMATPPGQPFLQDGLGSIPSKSVPSTVTRSIALWKVPAVMGYRPSYITVIPEAGP